MSNPKTVMIKPQDGLLVRDPLSMSFLDRDGEQKPRSTYWLRRLKCGDVVLVEIAKKQKEKQTKHEYKNTNHESESL